MAARPGSSWRKCARQAQRSREGDSDADRDRKSTRLNSSHLGISYAVFCLEKTSTGDNFQGRRWPAESFARLADRLVRERGTLVVVSAGPGEAPLLRDVIAAVEASGRSLVL